MSLPAGHRPQLDGLRAIAVALVALYHWFNITIQGVEIPFGFVGVGLFFVLSGYLITGILLNIRDKSHLASSSLWFAARSFTMRRIIRLVPAMYLYLIVARVTGYYNGDGWLWYYSYAGNFRLEAIDYWQPGVAHLWSLAVEEQFYLIAPAVVLLVPRAKLRSCFAISILGIAFFGLVTGLSFILPPTAFIGLLFGCLLAVEAADNDDSPHLLALVRLWPLLGGIWAAFVVARASGALTVDSYYVEALFGYAAMAGIVWSAAVGVRGPVAKFLTNPTVLYFGRISYGLYLWHFLAIFMRFKSFGLVPRQVVLIELLILWSITVAMASASYFGIERPFNELKNRFPYVRSEPSHPSDSSPHQPIWVPSNSPIT